MSLFERFHSLSLRWQICALLGVSLVASLLITGTMAYSQSRKAIITLTLDTMMAETNEAASELEHVLKSTQRDTRSTPTFPPIPGMIRCWDNEDGTTDLKGNSTLNEWIGRLTDILTAQMEAYPERLRCTVYKKSGEAVMQVEWVDGEPQLAKFDLDNVAGEEHFVHALGLNRRQTYTAPIRHDESEMYVQVFAPFFEDQDVTDGEVRGVFVITLDGARLLEDAARFSRSGEGTIVDDIEVTIVDETGVYLMPDRPEDDNYANEYPVRFERMSAPDSKDFYQEYISADMRPGGALLATYRKVFYDPADRTRFWLIAPSSPPTPR